MKRLVADSDLDLLLAAQPRINSPQLEARWLALRPELTRAAHRPRWPRWLMVAVPASLAAALALWLRAPLGSETPEVDLLFGLEESLAPAAVLLDPLNRELCLHLPTDQPANPPAP